MKLFTCGPVEMYENTLEISSKQIPYFRTQDFSNIMLKCQEQFLRFVNAPKPSYLAVMTASGTGAMETAVMNALNEKDKVLVIDGGGFGHRFSELCTHHGVTHDDIHLAFGETLTRNHLIPYENNGYTALLVNADETSTGQLYDLQMLGDFCTEQNMLFIVDAVSAFLVDEIDMQKMHIDLVLTASQKALALAPGLSFIVVNERMKRIIDKNECVCTYLDLKDAFKNMERGQTPYTPAVGIVLQLADRLDQIDQIGVDKVIAQAQANAKYFRMRCDEIGLKYGQYPLSNALTPLLFDDGKAYDYFLEAKEHYGLMLTPNGGSLSGSVLRVGHMGNLTTKDYDAVIEFLRRYCNEGYFISCWQGVSDFKKYPANS